MYLSVLHLDTGVETPEFARYVNRFRKTFDGISFRQADTDAVRVRIAVVDMDRIRALRDGRDAESFSENVGGDKQAVSRLMPVLVAVDGIVEGDGRGCLFALLYLQVQDVRLRQVDVRADAVFLLVGWQVHDARFVFVLEQAGHFVDRYFRFRRGERVTSATMHCVFSESG